MGRVLGDDGEVAGQPGDTLVTSHRRPGAGRGRAAARADDHDRAADLRPGDHKNYVADSGAAVVLEARTGRVVAMASQPTYDPDVWVGGISEKQLARLYSAKAGNPLLSPGHPGPVRARLDLEADHDRRRAQQRLHRGHPAGLLVGVAGRATASFKNYESGVVRLDRLRQGAADLLRHLLLPGRLQLLAAYGTDPTDVNAKDPLVAEAKEFGFGDETGIDLPGEARGRIADRHWKLAYWKSMKDYYCKHRQASRRRDERLPPPLRPRVLPRGQRLPRRRRGQLRDRAGRHDRHAAAARPGVRRALQRRHALRAADREGGRQPGRQGRPNGSSPKVQAQVDVSEAEPAATSTRRCSGRTARSAPWPGSSTELPARQGARSASKTGSAEVYGKQSTSWVASYDENYVVVMMVTQAGTGSGTSGPCGPQDLGVAVRRRRHAVDPQQAAIPGHDAARRPADVQRRTARSCRRGPTARRSERLIAAGCVARGSTGS